MSFLKKIQKRNTYVIIISTHYMLCYILGIAVKLLYSETPFGYSEAPL